MAKSDCSLKLIQKLISGKWKIYILWYLREFGELNRLLPNTARGVLTEQLKQLERDKIVHREVFDEMPPKVVYSLTEIGEKFSVVIDSMIDWVKIYKENNITIQLLL